MTSSEAPSSPRRAVPLFRVARIDPEHPPAGPARLDEPWSPHRAHRRLALVARNNLAVSSVVLVLVESILIWWLEALANTVARASHWLLPSVSPPVEFYDERYLGMVVRPMYFTFADPPPIDAAIWLGASLAGIALAVFGRAIVLPLRILGGLILTMVALSAAYLLAIGEVGMEAREFSALYLRTCMIIWMILPLVLIGLSAGAPMSTAERMGLVVLCLGLDIVLSTVRYALFVWVLASLGPLLMGVLFLVCGPLLDFVYLVSFSSILLLRTSKALNAQPSEERWAWL